MGAPSPTYCSGSAAPGTNRKFHDSEDKDSVTVVPMTTFLGDAEVAKWVGLHTAIATC